MTSVTTERVVIVGAGLGALYAALTLAPYPVLMISPEVLGEGASSAWAQGGVAAAMDARDTPEDHARDTVLAGAGTVDAHVATAVCDEAREHILNLTTLGTPFDRTDDGGYVMSREAAHSFARVVRVRGDQAGAEIMKALIATVRDTPSVQVLEGHLATGLDVVDGRVTGVWVSQSGDERAAPVLVQGAAHLLAGGGSGGLYKLTTNPPRIRGQVIGMAARAGAEIADAEFVQFHPTAIACGEDPAPLATEALRGEGAILINKQGKRFMERLHPDAELAPRDIVARGIYAQTQAGYEPALDTREAIGPEIMTQYPAVAEACLRSGIDPVTQPIPVAAAAHYHMGGIKVDDEGRASLNGLWCCGECASTGLHGANRLASNGLLEALVYARRAAKSIMAGLGDAAPAPDVHVETQGTIAAPREDLVADLRQIMTDKVGVVRNGADLKDALARIYLIEFSQPNCDALKNMTATATLIAAAALIREESRGAHFRSDFPQTNPTGERSIMTLAEAMDIRARYAKE